ncbi:MAG TPA: cation-transporting P-type ATPase, partial [Paracoccus sp.]|nr:cation-transporting P-type ATPase [Paracoccus sp. (in: a-proteobacteria)]
LARRTATIIRQNLAFAMGAMVILVAGGLFFELPLPVAVIGHEGGTVLVVLNGLRLLRDPIRRSRAIPAPETGAPMVASVSGPVERPVHRRKIPRRVR